MYEHGVTQSKRTAFKERKAKLEELGGLSAVGCDASKLAAVEAEIEQQRVTQISSAEG